MIIIQDFLIFRRNTRCVTKQLRSIFRMTLCIPTIRTWICAMLWRKVHNQDPNQLRFYFIVDMKIIMQKDSNQRTIKSVLLWNYISIYCNIFQMLALLYTIRFNTFNCSNVSGKGKSCIVSTFFTDEIRLWILPPCSKLSCFELCISPL